MPMYDVCLEATAWQWVTIECDSYEEACELGPTLASDWDCQNYEYHVNDVTELTAAEAERRR